MQHRSPIKVFLLTIITFGIYGIYWEVSTKGEMKKLGADIPTAWLLIVPLANIYWLWKFSKGVEHVTGGKMSGVLAFVILYLLSFIGIAIIQESFNHIAQPATAGPVPGQGFTPNPTVAPLQGQPFIPAAPVAANPQPLPDNSFGGPIAPTPTPAAPVTQPLPSDPVSGSQPPTQQTPLIQ
jgi:hypothetical protein